MCKTRNIIYLLILIFITSCSNENNTKLSEKSEQSEKSIWENSPYESTSVEMDLQRITPHAYYVLGLPGTPTDNEGFSTNAGVVITDEGVVVIDSLGTPSLAYLLLSKIRAITDKPIVKVIATHYHADHIYGLQVFKDEGAQIIAPGGAREYLASEAAKMRLKERRESLFPWVDEKTHLVEPDQYITEKYTFSVGGIEFIVDPIGSTHSLGDQTIYVPQENVLYAGDLIFEGRIPFVAGSNPEQWIETLSNLDASKFNIIVPGHGSASSNPSDAIKFTLGYLRFLHDNLSRAVENLQPFDEAYNEMDWSKYKDMPAAKANRMNAYFVYLGLEAASIAE